MKYRDNMTEAELAQLAAEIEAEDQCYAEAARLDEERLAAYIAEHGEPDEEELECYDPMRDGWVGKDGRP